MRWRHAAAVAATMMIGLVSVGGASADTTVTARVSTGAQLPFRAVIVSLPTATSLDPSNVHLFENGTPVKDFSLIPASGAAETQFGVVLVLDASDSMRGAPAESAISAARTFADKVQGTTQLAVIAFNSQTTVLLPLTRDAAGDSQALAAPLQLNSGTHLYDATAAAIKLLQSAHIQAGSVVVLSDGADTGSTATESEVAAAARKAHVSVYSVGLQSRAFDAPALKALATDGGGSFSVADSPESLASIYDRLGQTFANQYVIRYRTSQPANTDVKVAVKLDGIGVAETAYSMPAGAPGAPFSQSIWLQFWRSAAGMIVAALAVAILIGVAAAMIVRPRRSGLRARVGQFVSVDSGRKKETTTTPILTSRLYAGAERSLGKSGAWTRFKSDLELADIEVQPAQIVLATLLGALIVGWLFATVTGFPLLGLVGLAVLLVPRAWVQSRVRKRRLTFAEQLPDNLQVMASAMRAGHSFIGALSVVVNDSAEPSASEFRRAIADEQLGVPLEEALRGVVERMDNRDLGQVALVAAMQRETGGNTAEVLERVTETIRERFELRRLIKTLTAQGRMSRWVVSALPIFLLLIITLINPTYMQPLYDRPLGRALLIAAAGFIVAGSLVIKRIVDIKV
jgi:tight adherence protein B